FEEFMELLDRVEEKWSLTDKWGLNESFVRLGEKWELRKELKDRICEMKDDLMSMIAFGDEIREGGSSSKYDRSSLDDEEWEMLEDDQENEPLIKQLEALGKEKRLTEVQLSAAIKL
ncbi:9876_t:CDS:2, partial [Scutellospora calospora]